MRGEKDKEKEKEKEKERERERERDDNEDNGFPTFTDLGIPDSTTHYDVS